MVNDQKYLKYLLIAGTGILILLVVVSLIISSLSKKTSIENIQSTGNSIMNDQNNISITKQPAFKERQTTVGKAPTSDLTATAMDNQISKILPKPTNPSFVADSSSNVIHLNNSSQNIGEQQVFLNSTTPTPTINPIRPFVSALNTLFNNGVSENAQNISPSPAFPLPESQTGTGDLSGFAYYPQCDGPYDTYPLAGGCNICQAGCGQTTSAMILSSYVNKRFTPPVVADLFKQNGVTNVCNGTNIMDAQTVMKQNNLVTTDLIINTSPVNTQILEDFKAYLHSGWTLFTLGRYCDNGCGHFFWIVDIDADNNVWTYDPFYGRKKIPPPFNENQYGPFPYYRVAFGVKKP